VFVIGLILSVLSFWLNTTVVPNSKATVKQLIYEQAKRDPKSLLKPGVVQGDFKGDGDSVQRLLIEARDGDWVEGFHFYILPNSREVRGAMTYIHAGRAALAVDAEKSQLRVKLEDAYFESRNAKGEVEMAFAGEAEPLVIDLKNPRDRKPKASWMSNKQIRQKIAENPDMKPEDMLKMRSEIMGRYSFSLACLSFAFVAVPLGLQSSRRDTSRGLIMSLLVGAGYFLVTTLADQVKSESAATAILWAPNVACVLIGIFLFRRARFR
jgi:lipopolysaccharide export system permease protein